MTPALFQGQYVDVALTEPDKFAQFKMDHSDKIFSRGGVRADILKLDKAIDRVRKDEFFMHMISGDTQEIIAIESFHGYPYKCMMDCLNFEEMFLTDLKTCKALDGQEWVRISDGSFRKVSWIAYWRYPMQLALYREAVKQKYGFSPHPYIAAMEKISNIENSPNFDVFDLFDKMPIEGELRRGVHSMEQMGDMVDADLEDPASVKRCGTCEWCIKNKRLKAAKKFTFDPTMLEF